MQPKALLRYGLDIKSEPRHKIEAFFFGRIADRAHSTSPIFRLVR
jgi:hypothetical protein